MLATVEPKVYWSMIGVLALVNGVLAGWCGMPLWGSVMDSVLFCMLVRSE